MQCIRYIMRLSCELKKCFFILELQNWLHSSIHLEFFIRTSHHSLFKCSRFSLRHSCRHLTHKMTNHTLLWNVRCRNLQKFLAISFHPNKLYDPKRGILLNIKIAASSWTCVLQCLIALEKTTHPHLNAPSWNCVFFTHSFVLVFFYHGTYAAASAICFLHRVKSSSYLFKVILFSAIVDLPEKLETINSSHFLRGKQTHKILFLLYIQIRHKHTHSHSTELHH